MGEAAGRDGVDTTREACSLYIKYFIILNQTAFNNYCSLQLPWLLSRRNSDRIFTLSIRMKTQQQCWVHDQSLLWISVFLERLQLARYCTQHCDAAKLPVIYCWRSPIIHIGQRPIYQSRRVLLLHTPRTRAWRVVVAYLDSYCTQEFHEMVETMTCLFVFITVSTDDVSNDWWYRIIF